MQAVIQRVLKAQVDVDDSTVASIDRGILILFGVHRGDTENQARILAAKIAGMRMFNDDAGKMNLSVGDIGGAVLAVPQFTLAADTGKGRRPSFDTAAPPSDALPIFEVFTQAIAAEGVPVSKGAFQEHMHVTLVNDGPVTFVFGQS